MEEIHQLGYGPVNEGHVVNLIVKSAAEGAHHFLLTPKVGGVDFLSLSIIVHTSIHVSMLVVGCSYLWWSVVHCMLTVTTDVVCACLREICVHTVQ